MNPILAHIYSTILPSAASVGGPARVRAHGVPRYQEGDRAAHASGGGCRRPAGEGPRGEGRVAIRDPCRICCARSDSKWRLAAAVFRNIARLGDTPRRAFPYYSGRAKLETFLGAALPPSFLPAATEISRKAVAPRADRLLRGAFVGSESSLPQEPLAGRDNLNGAGFGFYALLFP